MKILTLKEVPMREPDILFRESCGRGLSVFFGGLACCVIALLFAFGRFPRGFVPVVLCYVIALICLFFAMAGWFSYRRAIDPSSWLCRVIGDQLWLRCTRRWSDRDPFETVVLQLDRADVAWMQPVKQHTLEDERSHEPVYVPSNPSGGVVHEFFGYMDIGLTAQAGATLDALIKGGSIEADHRTLIAPPAYTPEQPVQRMADGTIRVRWYGNTGVITPDLTQAADFFSRWTEVRTPRKEKVRYGFDS